MINLIIERRSDRREVDARLLHVVVKDKKIKDFLEDRIAAS